jgi:diaminohydroxyphosphoribosylaminopyrimidine deaminase/5-amino-6-(5-phosphoribosylamino)uracil reductase
MNDRGDAAHMGAALALARRGLGSVWPNPPVGCVLVRDGVVVGRGWTGAGGRPHAETEALRRAGSLARGATAYVTLEPCAHHGQTPPCCDALVASGVGRVVVAVTDPDPRVSGRGIAAIEKAGIDVSVGTGAEAAREVNAGFFLRVGHQRPLVTIKTATTLDGRIASRTGASRWITGDQARYRGHALRLRHDAVLVGSGTVLADDPRLTCRLPGLETRSPVRVVVDSHLSLPLTSAVVATALTVPTWIITLSTADSRRRDALVQCGVEVLDAEPDPDGRPNLRHVLTMLAGRGVTRLLVEGGGRISAGFLRAGLVDRVTWFRAAAIMGGDGLPAVAPIGIKELDQMPVLRRLSTHAVGEDMVETYAVDRGGDSAYLTRSMGP